MITFCFFYISYAIAFWIGMYTKLEKPWSLSSAVVGILLALTWPGVIVFWLGAKVAEYSLEQK